MRVSPPSPRGFWWGPGERLGGGEQALYSRPRRRVRFADQEVPSRLPCPERRAPRGRRSAAPPAENREEAPTWPRRPEWWGGFACTAPARTLTTLLLPQRSPPRRRRRHQPRGRPPKRCRLCLRAQRCAGPRRAAQVRRARGEPSPGAALTLKVEPRAARVVGKPRDGAGRRKCPGWLGGMRDPGPAPKCRRLLCRQ